MHWLLPAVAAAASAAFAAAVLRQYAARRRPHQLAWGIALSMFAVASLALTAGVAAAGFELELVDIDRDPGLARRYGVRVPVVAVDGEELFEYEVPVDLLRARLGRIGAD